MPCRGRPTSGHVQQSRQKTASTLNSFFTLLSLVSPLGAEVHVPPGRKRSSVVARCTQPAVSVSVRANHMSASVASREIVQSPPLNQLPGSRPVMLPLIGPHQPYPIYASTSWSSFAALNPSSYLSCVAHQQLHVDDSKQQEGVLNTSCVAPFFLIATTHYQKVVNDDVTLPTLRSIQACRVWRSRDTAIKFAKITSMPIRASKLRDLVSWR